MTNDREMVQKAVQEGVINQRDLEVCVMVALSGLASSYQSSRELFEMEMDDLEVYKTLSVPRLSLRSLRNHLEHYKREMFELMTGGYFPLRDAGKFSQESLTRYISTEVERLRKNVAFFNEFVPADEIKEDLGIHFPLHSGLSAITVELVLEYFDLNYLMRRD